MTPPKMRYLHISNEITRKRNEIARLQEAIDNLADIREEAKDLGLRQVRATKLKAGQELLLDGTYYKIARVTKCAPRRLVDKWVKLSPLDGRRKIQTIGVSHSECYWVR